MYGDHSPCLPKSFPQGVVNHDADSNDSYKTKKY